MHLIRVGSLDPAPVLTAMQRHDFGADTWRQDTPGTAHRDTQSLYLRMPSEISVHSVFHGLDVDDTPLMKEPAFAAAIWRLGQISYGHVARAMIVRLKPGGIIAPHIDEGDYSDATERYHWCLTTNPQCVVQIGDQREHMAVGEVWYFDKHSEHSVSNGDSFRDHLIFDIWNPL